MDVDLALEVLEEEHGGRRVALQGSRHFRPDRNP